MAAINATPPGFPILGVFRLRGQSKRDDGMIFGSCKAGQSPVYPIRDAFLAVNHASCPSLSSSGPRQWGESALKTSRLPGALSPSWHDRGCTLPQLGAGDNRPIRSNTPSNNRRGTDTSDNWKINRRECRTRRPPILISLTCTRRRGVHVRPELVAGQFSASSHSYGDGFFAI